MNRRRVAVLLFVALSLLAVFFIYAPAHHDAEEEMKKYRERQNTPDDFVDLRYTGANKHQQQQPQSAFHFSNRTLRDYGFPLSSAKHTDDGDAFELSSLVFVTAANVDRLHVDMDAVALVQSVFPNNTIYFYDLGGLSPTDAAKISQLCNVVYRKFDYSRYPTHVSSIFQYAWKPVIIHEVLREHRHVFWMDASIRFNKDVKFNDVIQQAAINQTNLLMFDTAGHSVFAATHAGMFRYLSISKQSAAKAWMHGANAIYMQVTQQLYDEVLSWWFLCALTHDCMAPTTDLFCKFKGRDEYAQCHRYDQSALNILLANRFDDDDRRYFNRVPGVLSVDRASKYKELLTVCPKDWLHKQRPLPTTRMLSKDFFVMSLFDLIVAKVTGLW